MNYREFVLSDVNGTPRKYKGGGGEIAFKSPSCPLLPPPGWIPPSRTQRSMPRWPVRETSMRRHVHVRLWRKISLVDRRNELVCAGRTPFALDREFPILRNPSLVRHDYSVYFFEQSGGVHTHMRKFRCKTFERIPGSQKRPETNVFKSGRYVLLRPR